MWLQMLYIRQSTTHVRTHTTGYKPFSCKQCYYECKQLTALTHERIHTNEKRFIQDARIAFTNMLGHSQEPTIYYSSKELCSTKISPVISVDCWRILEWTQNYTKCQSLSYNILSHFHHCYYLPLLRNTYHNVLTSISQSVYTCMLPWYTIHPCCSFNFIYNLY